MACASAADRPMNSERALVNDATDSGSSPRLTGPFADGDRNLLAEPSSNSSRRAPMAPPEQFLVQRDEQVGCAVEAEPVDSTGAQRLAQRGTPGGVSAQRAQPD